MTGKHGPQRRKEKLAGVVERQEARKARGDEGQLSRLIAQGHEHCKEFERLRIKVGK